MPTQQQRIDIYCCLASGHCSETAAAAGKHSAEVCKKSEPRVVCSKALSLRYDLVFVRKYFHHNHRTSSIQTVQWLPRNIPIIVCTQTIVVDSSILVKYIHTISNLRLACSSTFAHRFRSFTIYHTFNLPHTPTYQYASFTCCM